MASSSTNLSVIRYIRFLGTTNVTSPDSGASSFAFLTTPVRYLTNCLASFELKSFHPLEGCRKDDSTLLVKETRKNSCLSPSPPPTQESLPNATGILSYMTMHAAAVAAAVSNPPAAVAPIAPAVAACFIDTANTSSGLGPCCTYIGR
jgi:hypothetical protein